MADGAPAIEDHGIVGDGRTVALVATDGGIDFMCWPRFDSPPIFAALLDHERGGRFELAPALDGARRRQLYVPDTNVLLTRFLSEHGVAEISDFMVRMPGEPQRLVRRIKAVRNQCVVRMRCQPRFDAGHVPHQARLAKGSVVFESASGQHLVLHASVPLSVEASAAVAALTLSVGESASFVLEGGTSPLDEPLSSFVPRVFKGTLDGWREWLSTSTYTGRWRDEVHRSALVLKLLTSEEHGSMVAAPTFGLPESIGGERNWDYRYTWLRDSAFSVYAFLRLGFVEEANAFMRWLAQRSVRATDGKLQIVYGLDGRTQLDERIVSTLRGYRGSSPVRVGNAAAQQFQLDIYGELMDSVYLADKYGEQVGWEAYQALTRSLNYVVEHWREPDHGIWEIRGAPRHFLHSRLMCWVALDRGLRLANKRGLPAPEARWRQTRDAIAADIHEHFFDRRKGAFVQAQGSAELDAACLLMPLVRFISPTDPRWTSTMQAVRRELMDDSLVFRYRSDSGVDGLGDLEGTFNMCSFWYVECLARGGDLKLARFLFEKMLGYANHLGLYAEETGPAGEQLGNFPQAFTHVALISAAFCLDRALG